MRQYRGLTFGYAMVLSLIIGILTGAYLQAVNVIIAFFWRTLPNWLGIVPATLANLSAAGTGDWSLPEMSRPVSLDDRAGRRGGADQEPFLLAPLVAYLTVRPPDPGSGC